MHKIVKIPNHNEIALTPADLPSIQYELYDQNFSEFDFWVSPLKIEYSWQKRGLKFHDEDTVLSTFFETNLHESSSSTYVNSEELILKCENILQKKKLSATNEVLFLKLLSKISVCHSAPNLFRSTELMKWVKESSQSDSPKVFLEAWRILQNLKLKDNDGTSYLEGIYPFIPPWEEKNDPVADIVLVHGINGGASWTWRQHDSSRVNPVLSQLQRQEMLGCHEGQNTDYHGNQNAGCHGDQNVGCHGDKNAGWYEDQNTSCSNVLDNTYSWIWPLDWLSERYSSRVRIVAVDYPSNWLSWSDTSGQNENLDLNNLSEDLMHKLTACGIGSRPVVWIAHSMGGLIVKKILQMEASNGPANLLSSTRAFVFLSVPHFGTPVASCSCFFAPLLRPSPLIYHMKADCPQLKELHKFFVEFCNSRNVAVLSINETKPSLLTRNGPQLILVPHKYADPKVGEFYEIDANHMDTCKPRKRSDDLFRIIEEFLLRILKKLPQKS